MITDQQYLHLHKEYAKKGVCKTAALKSGMCRQTGAKYLKDKILPSASLRIRTYKTRKDAFSSVKESIKGKLELASGMPAIMVLNDLQMRFPGMFSDSQLRTLQRRMEDWRREIHSPEVFFGQDHKPGKWVQIDWVRTKEFNISIMGEVFDHLLCHAAFPFSTHEFMTVCNSENFASLEEMIQTLAICHSLPEGLQLDNSSSVTHRGKSKTETITHFMQLVSSVTSNCRIMRISN